MCMPMNTWISLDREGVQVQEQHMAMMDQLLTSEACTHDHDRAIHVHSRQLAARVLEEGYDEMRYWIDDT